MNLDDINAIDNKPAPLIVLDLDKNFEKVELKNDRKTSLTVSSENEVFRKG